MKRAKLIVILLIHRIIKILPDGVLLDATFLISPVAQRILPKKYQQLYKNHTIAFSQFSLQHLDRIVKRATATHLRSAVLDFKYGFSDSSKVNIGLEFPELQHLAASYKNKSVICVVPHFGMSLVAAKLLAKHAQRRVMVLVRGIRGDDLESELIKKMCDENIEFVRTGNSMEHVERAIKEKMVIVLGFDVVKEIKYKDEVDFFDRKVGLPSGPAWLAEKYKLPLVTAYAKAENKPFRIKIKVDPNVITQSKGRETTQLIATRLENYIKAHPGEWCIPDDYFASSSSFRVN